MEKIILIFLLGVCCSMLVNGFFLSKPFKNGCDPDPCKHKATCKLDHKNSNLSTCICTEGYHGVRCELKTGCNPSPCKKGECVVDKRNPSNFTCKCESGYVGLKCDTSNGCLKNPCKNNAVCKLDAKNKPICECKPGWTSSHCDKRNCTIVEFKGKHLSKQSAKLWIDKSIEERMKSVDDLAKLCKVRIHVLKSYIQHSDPNKGHQYDPRDPNPAGHYIGEALSINIYDENHKLICNDVCLQSNYTLSLFELFKIIIN